ncbi:MAG: aminotransferase class V-fold PLP-dependent enzyme [Eubacteriales bacterium]
MNPIYLDNAATTFPKPALVKAELMRCVHEYCGNPGRSGHRLSLEAAEQIFTCRGEICSLFHYPSPEHVIFCHNATHALNLSIQCMVVHGSHILLSDLEHNSVFRPIHTLAQRGLVSYDIFPHRGDIIQNLKANLRPETDMVVCTHTSNVSGFTFPIEEMGEFCKERGLCFIIDGAQSAGHLDIDLGRLSFDAFCAPGHKGLLGVQGSGFVILKTRRPLRDFIVGGSGSDSLSAAMPTFLPDRFEAGTLATPAIVSLLEGVRYLQKEGLATIGAQHRSLVRRLSDALAGERGIEVLSVPDNPAGIVSFNIEGVHPAELAEYLDQKNICVRAGIHCSPLAHRSLGTLPHGCVRVSFGPFNRAEDIDCLLEALSARERSP